jgi:hypothetical protein
VDATHILETYLRSRLLEFLQEDDFFVGKSIASKKIQEASWRVRPRGCHENSMVGCNVQSDIRLSPPPPPPPPPPPKKCEDVAPDNNFTCEDQAVWGQVGFATFDRRLSFDCQYLHKCRRDRAGAAGFATFQPPSIHACVRFSFVSVTISLDFFFRSAGLSAARYTKRDCLLLVSVARAGWWGPVLAFLMGIALTPAAGVLW